MTNSQIKYNYFVGLDIGKSNIDLAIDGSKTTYLYKNTKDGWNQLYKDHIDILSKALIVMENTGGYEYGVLVFLCEKKLHVSRCSANKIKSFIRSFGTYAKNDSLDAKHIAMYAKERHSIISPYQIIDDKLFTLESLVARKKDLTHMRVQEKK